ncbi:MAG: hypothetical protein ACRDQF_05720 [Thermocrispum sp.]
MTKVGILVHCRNLDTDAWEDLVFGRPDHDKLGDHATLARLVLTFEQGEELACVVFGRGLSWRDGLNEGEYSKKFLLDNLWRLPEFTRLAPLLARLDDGELTEFRRGMAAAIVTEQVSNTVDELVAAAAVFARHDVDKVVQIAAASHASRCIKEQAVVRSRGQIDNDQIWLTVATDMTYANTGPGDVCIIEPLHRRDQPITFVRPGLSEVIAPYFALPDDRKRAFIRLVDDFMSRENNRIAEVA